MTETCNFVMVVTYYSIYVDYSNGKYLKYLGGYLLSHHFHVYLDV